MSGLYLVGAAPVGTASAGGGPAPGTLSVSEQSAAISLVNIPEVVVTEQSAAISLVNIPSVVVTEQSVCVAVFFSPPRRRSGMLIA